MIPSAPAAEAGFSTAEAAARLRRFGPNELAAPRRFEALREVGRYLASPIVLVLLMASGVSALLGEPVSSTVIALMLVLGIALDFIQGYRSQRAARRLRERVGQVATVVRDGVVRDRPARDVVPDDVIHLAAGDLVPADARLLSARDLFVSEAALTGESLPREKRAEAGARAPDTATADTAVFRGTSVVSGFGTAVVVRTGAGTEPGRVAAQLGEKPPETEFERGTRRFGS